MIRWLLADRPELERFYTTTGEENVHMRRVNEQLGYTMARVMVAVKAQVDELSSVVDG